MTDMDRDTAAEAPADLIEHSIRLVAIAIALAGAFIALAIYWRPGPPRYQVVAMGDQVVRLNTKTGSMVACNVDGCGMVIHESRGIDENEGHALLPPREAPAARAALPAPSAAPAPTPAPAPSPAPAAAPAAPPAPKAH
ncbi:MAG TPA: hypothetical protein VFW19_04550 [Allosphingosinicella sp.]|nr:hypothetical protein [Allosphingosinicella sp.]